MGSQPRQSILEAGEGKRLMDAARAVVAAILEEEERLLAARRHTQQVTTESVITTSVGGLGGAFLPLPAVSGERALRRVGGLGSA